MNYIQLNCVNLTKQTQKKSLECQKCQHSLNIYNKKPNISSHIFNLITLSTITNPRLDIPLTNSSYVKTHCVCALNFQAIISTVKLDGSKFKSSQNLVIPSGPIFVDSSRSVINKYHFIYHNQQVYNDLFFYSNKNLCLTKLEKRISQVLCAN